MIIALKSLMGKLFTSTSLTFLGFYLKHTPPLLHFAQVFVFISMYYVGLLCFSVLEKWLYIGNVLWVQQHIPFWLPMLCALQVPLCRLQGPLCCGGVHYCGCAVGRTSPQTSWLPASTPRGGCQPTGGCSQVLITWFRESQGWAQPPGWWSWIGVPGCRAQGTQGWCCPSGGWDNVPGWLAA